MKLYKTKSGILIEKKGKFFLIEKDWDTIMNDDRIYENLNYNLNNKSPFEEYAVLINNELLPPIGSQEVWASGVTYYKSREARIEESKDAGGGDFYDRVYLAARPELFFKSPSYRVVGHNNNVRIRNDSKWNVPEPELALVVTSNKVIVGYTIGNDMSSRDIEGENPLYLPQAKTYDGSTSLGPCVYVPGKAISTESKINISIVRNGKDVFVGETSIGQMKRKLSDLVDYLFRELTFKNGVILMTGTGIVPPDSFTLDHGDKIHISIDNIGTLTNIVG